VRRSSLLKAAAWGAVAAGVAAPLLRKRVSAPPLLTQAIAFGAPVGLCVAVPRSRGRDVATCCLQMWAYIAAYKTPHDDELAQSERVHVDYPIKLDRALGLGELPSRRLQRAFARVDPETGLPSWRVLDHVLVWTHWAWFIVPHCALVYILVFRPERFSRAAVMTYAVFDIGASFYWLAPTAPPWYAASTAPQRAGDEMAVRRMMVEYGEQLFGDGWGPLYSVFGGNPLAAMPSLHLATSLMAALLLSETGPVAGVLGTDYALILAFALVYLGEHYVVDLLGGAVLTLPIYSLGPRARPLIARAGRAVAALEAVAHESI
jgi:hypothetical protein